MTCTHMVWRLKEATEKVQDWRDGVTCTAEVGVHVWHLFDRLRTHAVNRGSCLVGDAGEANICRNESGFFSKQQETEDQPGPSVSLISLISKN